MMTWELRTARAPNFPFMIKR